MIRPVADLVAFTICLTWASLAAAGPLAEKPPERPPEAKERFFDVTIVQDGRALMAAGGKVKLKKRPFQVVIRMRAKGAVQLNASTDPKLYQAARAGRSVAEVIPLAGTGMAEHDFNPDRDLMLSNAGYHYLHNSGPDSHRFDSVRPDGQGFVCTRSVDKLSGLGAGEGLPVSRFKGEVLYLVLVKSKFDPDKMESTAEQVEPLVLVFE